MKHTISETVDYTKLIKALDKVIKKVSDYLETPVNFAILFGEGSWDEVIITIEYIGLDHDFNTSVSTTDLYEVLTEYGEEKFVDGMVKTVMEDSMIEFFKYLAK